MTYSPDKADRQFRMLKSWSDLAAIEGQWRGLHERAKGHLFSSFDWLEIQEAAFDRSEQMHVATLWEGRTLVAALPLVSLRVRVSKLWKGYRPRTLGLMHCKYSGFQEVIARTDGHAAMLGAKLARQTRRCNIDLDIVVEKGPTAAFLKGLEAAGYIATREPNFRSILINGAQTYEAFLAGRSGNFRKSLRKAAKALDTTSVTFEVVDSRAPRTFERILDVSRRSWKHAAGTGIAADPANADFVRRVLVHDGGEIRSMTGFLTGPEGDIAFVVMVVHGCTSYGVWSEFDEAHERLSPGRSIIACVVAYQMTEGVAPVIDFVRQTHFTGSFGDEEYAIDRFRAFRRRGVSHVLSEADGIARRVVGAIHTGPRKTTRRADIKQVQIEEKGGRT